MFFFNLTLGQFLVLFTSASAFVVALYFLDRSRRRQVVSTLRFWTAAEQPPPVQRKRRLQQPWSLLLQIVSVALLLAAIAQLRWGSPAQRPRDHVLLLDTSAWMASRGVNRRPLIDEARELARAYVRAVPASDRVMLVRAEAMATPLTAFESDKRKLEAAIAAARPGATALNLDEALDFARNARGQGLAGEAVYVGPGRVGEREAGAGAELYRNLRVLPVADSTENVGVRKVGLRRSETDPELWQVDVYVRNYGAQPRPVVLQLGFGSSEKGAGTITAGSRRLNLEPGKEGEARFDVRTRAAGLLDVRLSPSDAFPQDNRALLEIPERRTAPVTVYSDQPELLRPLLTANPQVAATFRPTAQYRETDEAQLVILDRFRPARPPRAGAIWIDPPTGASPVPVRSRAADTAFRGWRTDHALGAGLRTHHFTLPQSSVFEAAANDIRIAEADAGAVIVARPGARKDVVFGFHPALSPLKYELATPLLFANLMRWMAPDAFRQYDMQAASPGAVAMKLESEGEEAALKVVRDDGVEAPFTARGGVLRFFSAAPGVVRVTAGDRETVHSLTLPQLWESKWEPPAGVRRGVPRFRAASSAASDLWQWLALLGAAGLIAEWILYGRLGRRADRRMANVIPMPAAGRPR